MTVVKACEELVAGFGVECVRYIPPRRALLLLLSLVSFEVDLGYLLVEHESIRIDLGAAFVTFSFSTYV